MFQLTVADVFSIKGRGTVVTGVVESGSVRVGDQAQIDGGPAVTVKGVEKFRKVSDEAHEGETVGLLLDGVERADVAQGAVLTGPGGGTVRVEGLGLT